MSALTVRAARVLRSRIAHGAVVGVAVVSLAVLCLLATNAPATTSGYIAKVTNSTNSVTVAPTNCTTAWTLDRAATPAIFQYMLNDAPLWLSAADASGKGNFGNYATLLAQTGSSTTPLACPRDTGVALVFNGTSTAIASNTTSASPASYSIEAWFKTTVAGGKIIGLGSSATGSSGTYDRHLYIDSTGKLVFGTYTTVTQTISSAGAVNDGNWHLAVGTQSAATGMTLYLDGVKVAGNTAYTTAQTNTGYWRIGYDNLNGWPNPPSNFYFTGQMRFVAAYSGVLTAAQVKADYLAGS